VEIYDDQDQRLYGFCGLSSSESLNSIWFAIPRGSTPPSAVYIKLLDRDCNLTYTSSSANISVAKPDLVVTSLSVTSYTLTSIAYNYTIKNIGTASANLDGPTPANEDNVSVQAYLSADTIFNNTNDIAAGGTILGNSPLGNLAPGATFSGSFSASAPVDPSVTPYLTLMVDWEDVVDESNETNNTAATLIEQGNTCYSNLPAPQLSFTGTEDYEANGQQWTRFWLSVTNRSAFPNELFAPAPHLPPCGLNANSARTWVRIYDNQDRYVYGFCALSSSENLNNIWFAIPRGSIPPNSVYIELVDRECNITYTSNSVSF
jgi:hypothetical protein